MIYKTKVTYSRKDIYIKVRLDDERKNGHQDFSITATVIKAGMPAVDRYFIMGGCCHELIEQAAPNLKPFILLHLCDYLGRPMHCAANMRYHLHKGFNSTKVNAPDFCEKFCEYYRVQPEQFYSLQTAMENDVIFSMELERLGILDQWKTEADAAILLLEQLTGEKFVNTSTRSNYTPPTEQQKEAERVKLAAGYYTPEQKKAREQIRLTDKMVKLQKERDQARAKVDLEYQVKAALLNAGEKYFENAIFYSHDNSVGFNWRGYGNELTPAEIEQAKNIFPDGITVKNCKK